MTDISINWNEFKIGSGKRPLEGEYKKTLILVTGPSMSGKSTISEELIENNNICYLNMDAVCLDKEHGIEPLYEFVNIWDNGEFVNLGMVSRLINISGCCYDFINYFFNKYIVPNPYLNILIDGYMFNLENILCCLLERCEEYNYNVWILKKVPLI